MNAFYELFACSFLPHKSQQGIRRYHLFFS
jgi:hypothetical protein